MAKLTDFIRNNTDHFGHTYGYHENYCLRVSPRSRDMVQGLLPFLVTRQLFAGAGMIAPSALRGRITIVDPSGRVALELTKEAGEPLSLALPDDTYAVHVDSGNGEFVATVGNGTDIGPFSPGGAE